MISRELSVLVLIPANATTDLDSAWLFFKKKKNRMHGSDDAMLLPTTRPLCCYASHKR
jgi:hypothetical protein